MSFQLQTTLSVPKGLTEHQPNDSFIYACLTQFLCVDYLLAWKAAASEGALDVYGSPHQRDRLILLDLIRSIFSSIANSNQGPQSSRSGDQLEKAVRVFPTGFWPRVIPEPLMLIVV